MSQSATVSDLISDLRRVIDRSPRDRAAHEALIESLRDDGQFDDLQNARFHMGQCMPLTQDMWYAWLEERSQMSSADERIMQLNRYTRAVEDHPWSLALWRSYLVFFDNELKGISCADNADFGNSLRDIFTEERLDALYDEALGCTKFHISNSQEIWDRYMDHQIGKLQAGNVELEAVVRMFLDRLAVPHLTIADTFTNFSTFVTMYDNTNYEKHLSGGNSIYQRTKALVSEREQMEHDIKLRAHLLDDYIVYLDWQRNKSSKSPLYTEITEGIFQQAITHHPFNTNLWHEMSSFLINRTPEDTEMIVSILQRGTLFCPEDARLWAMTLRAFCRCDVEISEIMSLKEKALTACGHSLGIQIVEIISSCFHAIHYLSASATQQISILQEGLNHLTDAGLCDEDFLLERLLIGVKTQAGELVQARKLWKTLTKVHGHKALFWLRYFHWELTQNNISGARALIKSGCIQTKDAPQLIFEAAKTFEIQHGSIIDYEKTAFVIEKATRAILESLAAVVTAEEENCGPQDPSEESSSTKRKAEEDDPGRKNKKTKLVPAKSGPQRDRESTTVIVRGLTKSATREALSEFFQDCGLIQTANISEMQPGGDFAAVVEFMENSDMAAALTKTFKDFQGRQITVESAQNTILFVTNWPPSHTEKDLRKLFSPFGQILDVRMPSLMYNQTRRFAYIQMGSSSQAQAALTLDGNELGERCSLSVKISNPAIKQNRHTAALEFREIVVKNLSWKSTEDDVEAYFSSCGKVESLRMPGTKSDKHHNGIAFIVFESSESTEKALSLDGRAFMDRAIIVELSRPGPRIKNAMTSLPNTMSKQFGTGSTSDLLRVKARTFCILHLPDTVNEMQLRKVLEPFGRLTKVTLRTDHSGAVVEYENPADAGKASLALQGQDIGGAICNVGTYEDLMRQPAWQIKDTPTGASLAMAPRKVRRKPAKISDKNSSLQKDAQNASDAGVERLAPRSSQLIDSEKPIQMRDQDFFRDLLRNKEQTDSGGQIKRDDD